MNNRFCQESPSSAQLEAYASGGAKRLEDQTQDLHAGWAPVVQCMARQGHQLHGASDQRLQRTRLVGIGHCVTGLTADDVHGQEVHPIDSSDDNKLDIERQTFGSRSRIRSRSRSSGSPYAYLHARKQTRVFGCPRQATAHCRRKPNYEMVDAHQLASDAFKGEERAHETHWLRRTQMLPRARR